MERLRCSPGVTHEGRRGRRVNQPFTLTVSTRNLIRDRFLARCCWVCRRALAAGPGRARRIAVEGTSGLETLDG
jgi:hypothetical protein